MSLGALTRSIAGSGLDATGSSAVAVTSPGHLVDGARTVEALGRTLSQLHATSVVADGDAEHTPGPIGPARPDRLVRRAREALVGADPSGRAGDHVERSPAYRHMTSQALVEVLARGATSVSQATAPLVLTHGRPTLDRLLVDQGRTVGFVDWDDADLSHRERDLAAAARSVIEHFGAPAVPALFESYGARPDPFRLDWYSLAVELVG